MTNLRRENNKLLSNKKKTLIFIPAFNEEKTIYDVVLGVKEIMPDADILVIDDGSSDNTRCYALKAGANVFSLPFHAGGPIVIITAYLIALSNNFSFLLKIDGDGQHDPKDLLKLYKCLANDEADIIIGSRYMPGGQDQEANSLIKRMGRAFTSTLIDFAIKNMKITDATSGLRGWNKKALNTLISFYFEENTIIPEDSVFWPYETIIANKKGLRIKEVPITVKPRKYGRSKSYTTIRMIRYFIDLTFTVITAIRT